MRHNFGGRNQYEDGIYYEEIKSIIINDYKWYVAKYITKTMKKYWDKFKKIDLFYV